jgi:predicted alpha/beta-hydrolase family hydrolase
MRHEFMETMTAQLAARAIATFRYEFSYMESGRRRPDPPHLLEARVRDAVAEAASQAGELPMVAGGKSMGGRMTSRAAAQEPLAGVRGLVFVGFPLHAPGRASDKRAEHLDDVSVPMLFLQGTRDNLADLELIGCVCRRLGKRAKLHVVDGADHSFKVLKRSGRTADDVFDEMVTAIDDWLQPLL